MTPATHETHESGESGPDADTEGASPDATGIVETCEVCDEETEHAVSIRIRTENEASENADFSREPYRFTECQTCGRTRSQRLNDR